MGWPSRKAGNDGAAHFRNRRMPAPPAVVPSCRARMCKRTGRDLFRYVVTPEWADYRAIMGVFADTFFSEFTPEDVAARLADASATCSRQ